MDKILSTSVKEFLSDFLANSETYILEEGKEQNDILAVAEARGYNLKNRKSLAGFKTIYTFADRANINKARLPKDILLKVLPEIIGTPVDIDHVREFVVGHYIDYRYIASEDKIIAYGVFYKSNFADKWKEAQRLFKAGKLGTSYEIYCPKNKRKYLPDGTYELTTMEIAGGALIFKQKPAFEDALVLETAKINTEILEEDLVVASVNKINEEDLITSSIAVDPLPAVKTVEVVPAGPADSRTPVPVVIKTEVTSGRPITEKELLDAAKNVTPATIVKGEPPIVPVVPVIPKIKCGHCQKEFDNTGLIAQTSEKKCPHCQSIVGEQGEVKFPPQIIDFSMSCPSCRSSNWLLMTNDENSATVKCQNPNCKKEFTFSFQKDAGNELIKKMSIVYLGSANCPQCGSNIPFSTTSQTPNKSLKCPSCELDFNVDIAKANKKRKISKVNEVAVLHTASAEGGEIVMDQNTDSTIQPQEQVPVVPVEQLAPAIVENAPIVPVEELIEVEDADAFEMQDSAQDLVTASVMTTEQRNSLPDSVFAVIKNVKDKKTGGTRKVRMYPLNDAAHVRSALSYINHPDAAKSLNDLGIKLDEVKSKIEAKAKDMNIASAKPVTQLTEDEISKMQDDLCIAVKKGKKMTKLFKAACAKKRSLQMAAKIVKASVDVLEVVQTENTDLKAKITLLEANAVKVVERKNMLGEKYCKNLSDNDILDEDKFKMAMLEKENDLLKSGLNTASAHISIKGKSASDTVKVANGVSEIVKNELKY